MTKILPFVSYMIIKDLLCSCVQFGSCQKLSVYTKLEQYKGRSLGTLPYWTANLFLGSNLWWKTVLLFYFTFLHLTYAKWHTRLYCFTTWTWQISCYLGIRIKVLLFWDGYAFRSTLYHQVFSRQPSCLPC